MQSVLRLSLAIALLSSVNLGAQSADVIDADRPGLADSSAVIGKGQVQIEAGLQWESRPGSKSLFAPILLRVGVFQRFEVRAEGNSVTTLESDGRRETGLSPTSVGFAYSFQRSTDTRPGIGVIGRVFPASGTKGFASHRAAGDARLAVDWNLTDSVSLNPNVGVAWYEDDGDRFAAALAALTLAFAPQQRLMWFVDAGLQAPEERSGATALTVDGGVAFIAKNNLQFDLSAGTRVFGETPPRPFIAVGFAVGTRR